jgi:hypothetical protein
VGGFLGETMTIAEIIAAKKIKAAGAAAWAGKFEEPATPQADLELGAAIDRIDPPGKRRAGMVLSASTPLPKADVAEKAHHAESRSLSRPSGEAIPMTPTNAQGEVATWHEALNSFESSLCVMRDPKEPEVIWLAVRAERAGLPPILIHRLPWLLWDHPAAQADPF